jgi:Glycosyl transferase 4-like domain
MTDRAHRFAAIPQPRSACASLPERERGIGRVTGRQSPTSGGSGRPAILCLSQSFSPDTTPTAIRATKLIAALSARWDIVVLTESQPRWPDERMRVEVVRGRRPRRALALLRRLHLAKLLEMIVWPDESIFWLLPAILAGRRVIRETSPTAIVVFMMPYSAGLAGVALSRLSGLPLILNLDDSPTCTDMHPHFPSRLHYRLARALENFYVRRADAIVYVSQTNLDLVKDRQPERARQKLHLVRYGADRADVPPGEPDEDDFGIAYVGAMSGWWSLIEQDAPAGKLGRLYGAWTRLGRYERTALDQRTSSPAIIGKAILDAIAEHPSWAGRVRLAIYGNPYPEALVAQALERCKVESVVSVFGPVAHSEIASIIARADLLFITLPNRLDDSPGGRISAKTYEYLTTDRPILAAVPHGENRAYLADKPGVWLVAPDDSRRMKEIVSELVEAKFSGSPRTFDRSHLQGQLSYATRASEFAEAVRAGIEHRAGSLNRAGRRAARR